MRTATASRTESPRGRTLFRPGTFHACGCDFFRLGTSCACGDRIVVPDGVECPRLEQDAPGRVECPRRWATCTARRVRPHRPAARTCTAQRAHPSLTEVRRQDFLKSY